MLFVNIKSNSLSARFGNNENVNADFLQVSVYRYLQIVSSVSVCPAKYLAFEVNSCLLLAILYHRAIFYHRASFLDSLTLLAA